jgi:hypothetical protein
MRIVFQLESEISVIASRNAAEQSSAMPDRAADWIASSAFGLLAMTDIPDSSRRTMPARP